MREQRLVKPRVAVLRNDHILAFGEVLETSLTFWDSMNSFSVRFAILLTLCHTYCCTWPTVTKALPMPTNSNAHVSPVGSKVMRCTRGIHCERTPSYTSYYVWYMLHTDKHYCVLVYTTENTALSLHDVSGWDMYTAACVLKYSCDNYLNTARLNSTVTTP